MKNHLDALPARPHVPPELRPPVLPAARPVKHPGLYPTRPSSLQGQLLLIQVFWSDRANPRGWGNKLAHPNPIISGGCQLLGALLLLAHPMGCVLLLTGLLMPVFLFPILVFAAPVAVVSREPSSFCGRCTLVVAKVASAVTCTSCLHLYPEKLGLVRGTRCTWAVPGEGTAPSIPPPDPRGRALKELPAGVTVTAPAR